MMGAFGDYELAHWRAGAAYFIEIGWSIERDYLS
jgi:hypothetical protein